MKLMRLCAAHLRAAGLAVVAGVCVPAALGAQSAEVMSELRDSVARLAEDRAALGRRYTMPYAPRRAARLRSFYEDWDARLQAMDFDALSVEGRIDWLLLDHRVRYELETLEREALEFAEMKDLIPFATAVMELEARRRDREWAEPREAAEALVGVGRVIEETRARLEDRLTRDTPDVTGVVAWRAASTTDALRETLARWYTFHAGYDPLFTWWSAGPHAAADAALREHARFLRERLAGVGDERAPIIADPIGADGMRSDLAVEMIPYSPEELLAIAEREFAWCEVEMRRAARDMGYGEDWRAALEKVKTLHVEPGRQPEMVRDLAYEAIEFLKSRDLVTIPPLAEEIWRIEMMSPERQLVNPFFTGGETITVSYPTDGMAHEDKLMSMRGNNIHFSRATVHHELIPGHHLQGFMTDRYNAHRQIFSTPFWGEGWALYWEMLLWDLGFPATPEDRVGFLFWRSHRAARILFSLGVHLGTMTPDEAVELLVQRVGHERANAEAEVRRSFNGSYPPLYQAAYMLGGLQIRALHRELVQTGRMTDKQFHDAILRGGRMPIEMVRARLLGLRLERDWRPTWRFYDEERED